MNIGPCLQHRKHLSSRWKRNETELSYAHEFRGPYHGENLEDKTCKETSRVTIGIAGFINIELRVQHGHLAL